MECCPETDYGSANPFLPLVWVSLLSESKLLKTEVKKCAFHFMHQIAAVANIPALPIRTS
jgi:hypothetical protein